MIAYLFTIIYILVNHSFNKIFLIWNQYFDMSAHLMPGLSMWMIASSNIFSSSSKLMGSFIEYFNLKNIIVISFLINGICIYISLTTQNSIVFSIFRNLQGYISGIQNSISIGLIGSLPKASNGFAKYTGCSAIVSFLTVIILSFSQDVILIKWILVLINILGALLFTQIDCNHPYKTIPIIKNVIYKIINHKEFWYNTIIVGCTLGIGLFLIGQQKFLLKNFFHMQNDSLNTMISGSTFLVTSTISFIYFLHTPLFVYILFFLTTIFILLGLYLVNSFLFISGIVASFSIFTLINPILSNDITTLSDDKFVTSSYFFCVRSFFTSISMSILNIFSVINSIYISIILLSLIILFYCYKSYKQNV